MTSSPSIQSSQSNRVLLDKIEADSHRLLKDVLREPEFYEYRPHQEALAEELKSRINLYADDFFSEVGALLSDERAKLQAKAHGRKLRRVLNLTLYAYLVLMLYFAISVPFKYRGRAGFLWFVPTFNSAGSIVLLELILVVILTLLAGARTLILAPSRREEMDLTDDLRVRTERYQVRLRNTVSQELRLAIPAMALSGTTIEFEHTPALVELALADIVSTTAVREVEDFVTSHKASALGLAAPRGAGKTTILRHLTSKDKRSVKAYIPAPVRYEADELLARIFEVLATEYLGKTWQSRSADLRNRFVVLGLLLSFYAGAGVLALGYSRYHIHVNGLEWVGITLSAASLAGLAYLFFTSTPVHRFFRPRNSQGRQTRESLMRQARRILNGLRWQQQRTATQFAGTAPWSGLINVYRQRTVMVSQREVGRPRLVGDFQDFVRMILRDTSIDRIIIAIDELDKLPSVEDVVAVVTELKDILHLEGTHVLVSVSEDVLNRFAARGMPKRDVFDSSFDEVIQLPELTSEEAVRVLQSRATGFPRAWALVCYALSGGVTRDLLRHARRCVALYRISDKAGSEELLNRLVGEVAEERAMAVLRGSGILSRLTELGYNELQSASKASGVDRLTELRGFALSLDESSFNPLLKWLDWAIEVTEKLIGFSPSNFDSVAEVAFELAKRGREFGRF